MAEKQTTTERKRFYWLKLHEDFFRQKEIKKLRMIAGGDTYVLIYLKLLLLSLKTDGRLYYDGVEDDFCGEMALEIDESVENVTVTVNFLLAQKIIQENAPDEYELTTCAEMTGSEGTSARRVRNYRNRQKALQRDAGPLHCNSDVTSCNTEKEIEKELELENRDKRQNRADTPPSRSTDFESFWSAYPKKVGKQAAKKAFDRVKVPVETLLGAIERQKCSAQWSKDGGQYIPNPATWLNQGRWEDELERQKTGNAEQFQNIPGVTYC